MSNAAPKAPAAKANKRKATPVSVPVPDGGFQITKNAPMPDKGGLGGKGKYPWADMVVGDAFFVENGNPKSLSSTARQAGQRMEGVKFACRSLDGTEEDLKSLHGGKAGVGVWRIL